MRRAGGALVALARATELQAGLCSSLRPGILVSRVSCSDAAAPHHRQRHRKHHPHMTPTCHWPPMQVPALSAAVPSTSRQLWKLGFSSSSSQMQEEGGKPAGGEAAAAGGAAAAEAAGSEQQQEAQQQQQSLEKLQKAYNELQAQLEEERKKVGGWLVGSRGMATWFCFWVPGFVRGTRPLKVSHPSSVILFPRRHVFFPGDTQGQMEGQHHETTINDCAVLL